MYKLLLSRILLFTLIWFLGLKNLESQNKQFDFKISNDKFVFKDKYYTSGLHLTYRKALANNFLLNKKDHQNLQLNVTIGNETFTPTNLSSFNVGDLDRPYAGWMFLAVELAKIKSRSALFLSIESGITGKESLAGKLQNAFHDLINIDRPTWTDEIAYHWLFNFKSTQIFELITRKNVSFQNHTSLSFGSKDTYLENKIFMFFGRLSELQNSYRALAVNSESKKEFYGFLGAGYKYVALNTLIQGSPLKDIDPFTSIAENHVFTLQAGSVLRTKRHVYKLEYLYNSKETPLSKSHIFGALTFGSIF